MENIIDIVKEAIKIEGTYHSNIEYIGLSHKETDNEVLGIDIITNLKTQDEKRAFGKILGAFDFSDSINTPLKYHQWTPNQYKERFGDYCNTPK